VSLRQSIVTLYILFAFLSRGISQDSIPAIGQWKDHLPYHSAIDVSAGNNKIFCATPYSVFNIDLSENSIISSLDINGRMIRQVISPLTDRRN